MAKYANFLRETELFYNLSPLQLEMVDSVCEEKNYREGEVIFPENSHEKELYLIFRGEIEIFVNPGMVSANPGMNSKPEVIANLLRGQSFGEVALVDQGVRSAGARAASRDTQLVKISRERLLNLCNSYPELGYRVMLNLAQDLAQKIRNADLKIREVLLYQTRRSSSVQP
jgi:CRP/FNR family transcriptional regulator, cyclic AMP receptor protein